ncbi:AraC family transcriptional regulator [Rhizobium terrae]|uniref:AraC family transcriptional regulator n=1 Tax=Rhizobium terrae TaxID=2171756 RepID=UPI0013C3417D|nr:AraC family transcriptional regulator [Rhizobium terrae]
MKDPFTEVLAVLGTRSVRGTSLEAGGEWALSFDGRERLKFVAVMKGQCWLVLPDRPPEVLKEGDVILLSDTCYTVASDPGLNPSDGMTLYASLHHNTVSAGRSLRHDYDRRRQRVRNGRASFVLDALPRFLRLDPHSSRTEAIARTLVSLKDEADAGRIGGGLVAERLADILVVQAVRAYVADHPAGDVGWITALADQRLGKVITLMHRDVARRWTIEALAGEVGMSRSALTLRFTQRVGRPPLDHLTRWRMILAQRELARGRSVSEVAEAVGYTSQSAFGHAYKRTMGHTPRGR